MYEKEDRYVRLFMGSTYDFSGIATVGELRSKLEKILDDLPDDNRLKVAEIHGEEVRWGYLLEEGVVVGSK